VNKIHRCCVVTVNKLIISLPTKSMDVESKTEKGEGGEGKAT
jgi:hypothetical protein